MKSFKSYLTEGVTTDASKYEVAIILNLLPSPEHYEEAKVRKEDFINISKNKVIMEAGQKIANNLLKQTGIKKSNATVLHTGRLSSPITEFWKENGGSNPTPKTDVILDNYKISLKMGRGQLMSGGKGESLATFQAAIKNTGSAILKDPRIIQIQDAIENFVESSFTDAGNVAAIQKKLEKKKAKSQSEKLIQKGMKVHSQVKNLLSEVFKENHKFQIEFVKEAMSGYEKFGKKSLASANHVLVAEPQGTIDGFHLISQDSYCAKIASQTSIAVRFKSSSQKSQGVKTGKYNFWSVVALITEPDKEKMESFVNDNNLGTLTEGWLDNIIEFFRKVSQYIKNVFEQGLESILEFFGFIDFDVEVKDKPINF